MQIDTGTDTVIAEIDDGVGTVILNRPERRNALHPDMFEAVPRLLDRFERDPDVACIVVTGAGTAFCAGGDVRDGIGRRAAGESPPQPGSTLLQKARMVTQLHESAKITLAVLPGAAVGAGVGIALSTDLRIASASARIIPGWGALAFSGDFGGTWLLANFLGPSKAIEVFVDNTILDAETCLRLGLFNKVVTDNELPVAAKEWAKTIAAGPQTAHSFFKQNVRQARQLSLAEALPLESERMTRSGQTVEHREAVKRWIAEADAKRTSGPTA